MFLIASSNVWVISREELGLRTRILVFRRIAWMVDIVETVGLLARNGSKWEVLERIIRLHEV
jgi:hypothetical protein